MSNWIKPEKGGGDWVDVDKVFSVSKNGPITSPNPGICFNGVVYWSYNDRELWRNDYDRILKIIGIGGGDV